MNEAIGEKGGKRDRKRVMVIKNTQKKKLEQEEKDRELAELEKKVRKKQIYTLIKTLPIVIGGGTIQTLYHVGTGKIQDDKEDENSRWRIKEYDADVSIQTDEEVKAKRRKIITTPTGEKVVIYLTVPEVTKVKEEPIKDHVEVSEKSEPKKEDVPVVEKTSAPKKKVEEKPSIQPQKKTPGIEPVIVPEGNDSIFEEFDLSPVDFSYLPKETQDRIEKLKTHKIVEEYEKQLKDVRYELRKIIYEYHVLVDEESQMVLSKDAENLLERLTDIIDKIDELKKKLRIEDLEYYDDNYLYYLIEGYLKAFERGKLVSEIKDSPLYVLLSEKLEELEEHRGKFQKRVEEEKEQLEEKEEDFEQLKEKYYSFDRLNQELVEFQLQQEAYLKEITDKVKNATTESERIQEEVVGMSNQSRRLLNFLSIQMFLPGPRFAKGFAASAAAYLYFMNHIVRPNTVTKKYRVITVKDYHDDIQNSIHSIDNAMQLLGKTGNQIDKMISEIKDKYHDYLDVVPECSELLRNLEKIKSEVEEKEYEMNRMKKEQELQLEKNDAKVKTMGEYPVN